MLATARNLVVGASLLATAGCNSHLAGRVADQAPAGIMAPATTTTGASLALRDGDSRIELRVDRAGPLARLGHRHVIITNAVHGAANFDPTDITKAYFSAVLPVDTLQVDLPEERAAAGEGFNTVLDAAAIAGTREHMLSPVLLDAARFPEIGLRLQQLTAVDGTAGTFRATVVFTVKGEEHALQVPVEVTPLPGGIYIASGAWTVTHAELGLTPYSAVGGLLKVADSIEVRFRLVAKPL